MAQYLSEFTEFINQLKQSRPVLKAQQQQGYALLWTNTPIDLDARSRLDKSRVKQQAYVYQTHA
ncbi:MAG: DUF3460 family protein [Ottowia sp.]|nr:DUF3460 family protein [Ottowia sp.]